MKEKQLQDALISRLSEYFYVYSEVKTVCGQGRIDLILNCKESMAWFGVEIKQINYKRGNDIGLLIKQANRYAFSDFNLNGIRKVPVFIFPAISYDYMICREETVKKDGVILHQDRHKRDSVHHTFNGILGVFRVGEIRVFERNQNKYIRFVFNNKEIWTNKPNYNKPGIVGLHYANYEFLTTEANGNNI